MTEELRTLLNVFGIFGANSFAIVAIIVVWENAIRPKNLPKPVFEVNNSIARQCAQKESE